MSIGNACHNVDSHGNFSVSVCNNNDVNLDYERNVSGRISFIDHDDDHSKDFSLASDMMLTEYFLNLKKIL